MKDVMEVIDLTLHMFLNGLRWLLI